MRQVSLIAAALIAVACGRDEPSAVEAPAAGEPSAFVDAAVAPIARAARPAEPAFPLQSGVSLWRERVGRWAVIRLPFEGFSGLSPAERRLAYHLSQASLAGRDISWDQNHALSLALRRALEEVIRGAGSLPGDLGRRVGEYARRVWIGNGPYDPATFRKILPGFERQEWGHALSPDLERLLFDPATDPILASRAAPQGVDPLAWAGVNLYDGVRLAHLDGFEEQYPRNSRLVYRAGGLVEEVYRTGRSAQPGERPAPSGRYAEPLSRVVSHLRDAIPWAAPAQQARLSHLVDHLETGSEDSYTRSMGAWLEGRPVVDAIIGFHDTHKDPRAVKGEWEGLIFVRDRSAERLFVGLADAAAALEKGMPWADEFKRSDFRPRPFEAVQVIAAHGGAAPALPAGIDLPDSDSLRREFGSRSLLLMNVLRAIDEVVSNRITAEFAPPAERATAFACAASLHDVWIGLHELVGHSSGRMSEALLGKDPATWLKEYATTIEEARADLVALHLLASPRVRELAGLADDRCVEEGHRRYVRRETAMLHRVAGSRIRDEHLRAGRLVVAWAESRGVVVSKTVEGRRYPTIGSLADFRSASAELLAELQRIKAEGDYAGARRLVERFATRLETQVRDDVAARVHEVLLPAAYAFVMPELKAVRDSAGRIEAVDVVHEQDLQTQMLRWSQSGL